MNSKNICEKYFLNCTKVIPEEEYQECNVDLEYDHTDSYGNMLLSFSLFGMY